MSCPGTTTPAPIGRYDFPEIRRGDTFRGRHIATLTLPQEDDAPVSLLRARLEVRTDDPARTLIARWATDAAPPTAAIAGDDDNIVALHPVSEDVTKEWPIGHHIYDLEVWFTSDGAKKTLLTGHFPIAQDVTANAPIE